MPRTLSSPRADALYGEVDARGPLAILIPCRRDLDAAVRALQRGGATEELQRIPVKHDQGRRDFVILIGSVAAGGLLGCGGGTAAPTPTAAASPSSAASPPVG